MYARERRRAAPSQRLRPVNGLGDGLPNGSARGVRGELRTLVVDFGGDGTKPFLVLLAMVGTEEQLASGSEDDAEVGLCAAAVAAIERVERLGGEEVWCQDSGHVAPSFCVDCARGPDPRLRFQARCAGPGVRSAARLRPPTRINIKPFVAMPYTSVLRQNSDSSLRAYALTPDTSRFIGVAWHDDHAL